MVKNLQKPLMTLLGIEQAVLNFLKRLGKVLTLDTKEISTMIYALVGMVGFIIPLPIVESELRKRIYYWIF